MRSLSNFERYFGVNRSPNFEFLLYCLSVLGFELNRVQNVKFVGIFWRVSVCYFGRLYHNYNPMRGAYIVVESSGVKMGL